MAVARFCPHGNLRVACAQCRADAVSQASDRAAANRARGESGRMAPISGAEIPYPWQRGALEAWQEAGRVGLIAFSPGLPLGDLAYAVMGEVASQNPSANILVACADAEVESVRSELQSRFAQRPSSLLDHHFLEPRDDGTLVVAGLGELETVDLPSWGRFASTGILVLLDADGVGQGLGQFLVEAPFRYRFALTRQPSAIDLVTTRPWSRAFGPVVYRATEDQAREMGILPRIRYRLHVEMLKPEVRREAPRGGFRDRESRELQGPWEPSDIPTTITVPAAGAFVKGRARDVASMRAKQQTGLLVVHDGVPVPGAQATLRLQDLPDRHAEPPEGWVLATPTAEARAILRLATLAFKTLGKPGSVEDAVVLPVAADLCRQAPWSASWKLAAIQIDRVVAGLLLAESVADAMTEEDLESLVGVALALRGLPQDDLHALTPIVAEAAQAAHRGNPIAPQRVSEAARASGGFAAALLVAAELGPLQLLRLAHPRFTPVMPDLPHPSLCDARRHAWRGRAFAALANAARAADLVTAWGRYPELRFVFPSSAMLEAATAYCAKHKLRGPLDEAKLRPVADRTKIAPGDRAAAAQVLRVWNDSLGLAEEHEREFLADLHARQPERERRREGAALPGLHVAQQGADSVTLEARDGRLPATNISPGSEVALVESGEREEIARGLVSRITTRRVVIDFPAGAPRRLPREVTVNLTFDAKVFEAYHSAVLGAQRALSATTPVDEGPDGLLRAALLGEVSSKDPVAQSVESDDLTASQKESIEAVLSGGRVRLVHGPPGTGKTHTLVRLAVALTRAGHSVLCTADSNAAVDNLVVGLRRSGALVVRIGHAVNLRDEAAQAARIDPLDAPLFVRWAAEQGIVVATTNYGAFRYVDPKGGMTPFIFDYVIHDEAGQSTAPSSLAAVLRARRLVLAGDPKQLPPTVVSMDAKEAGLDITLFERIEELTGRDRTTLLRTQFRMREPILAFSNKRYYDGLIETAPSAAAQEGLPDLPACAFQHVTGRENDRQRNGSISNDFEVAAVAALVERFRNEVRDRGWTMAVLTPYQAQREILRRRLPDTEVSTVDGAQGREWDIVLYSSVRSNPQHRIGFVEDERRLNVAVTRARRHFILVGDERTLRDHENFGQLLDSMEKVRLHFPDQDRQDHRPARFDDESRGRRGRRGRGRRGRDGRPGGFGQSSQGGRQDSTRQGGDGGRRRDAQGTRRGTPAFSPALEQEHPDRLPAESEAPRQQPALWEGQGRRPERRSFTLPSDDAERGAERRGPARREPIQRKLPSEGESPVGGAETSPDEPPVAPRAGRKVRKSKVPAIGDGPTVVSDLGKDKRVKQRPAVGAKPKVANAKTSRRGAATDAKAEAATRRPKKTAVKGAKAGAQAPGDSPKTERAAAGTGKAKGPKEGSAVCGAVTQSGTRCKRKPAAGSKRCAQHA